MCYLIFICLICLCSSVFFFFLMIRRPPRSTRTDTLFPYTTLFRSTQCDRESAVLVWHQCRAGNRHRCGAGAHEVAAARTPAQLPPTDGRPEAKYRAGAPAVASAVGLRTEERRVGKEGVSKWRRGGSQYD